MQHAHAMKKQSFKLDSRLDPIGITLSSDGKNILVLSKPQFSYANSTLHLYTLGLKHIKNYGIQGNAIGQSGDITLSLYKNEIHTFNYKTNTSKQIHNHRSRSLSLLSKIKVSPDNTYIIIIAEYHGQYTPILINMDTKEKFPQSFQFFAQDEQYTDMAFHPTKNMLIVITNKGRLGLYTYNKHCFLTQEQIITCEKGKKLSCPTFNKTGTSFATCSPNNIYIYQLNGATLKLNKVCKHSNTHYLQYSPNSKHLISGSKNTSTNVCIWSTCKKSKKPAAIYTSSEEGFVSYEIKYAFFINGQKEIIICEENDLGAYTLHRLNVPLKYRELRVPTERFDFFLESKPTLYNHIKTSKE